MKNILLFLSILLFVFLLSGCSSNVSNISEFVMWLFIVVVVCFCLGIFIYDIIAARLLRLIKKNESELGEAICRNSFGDDRCKFYFNVEKKQVLIMRFSILGVQKIFVDSFEYGNKQLYLQNYPYFCFYDSKNQQILAGSYKEKNIDYNVKKINNLNESIEKYSAIEAKLVEFQSFQGDNLVITYALIDESKGLIALVRNGRIEEVFSYVYDAALKTGLKSFVTVKNIGDYLFIMDDFFNKLVIITPISYEIFNYNDILDVSYEEDGVQIGASNTARNIGSDLVRSTLIDKADKGMSVRSGEHRKFKTCQIKILFGRNMKTTTFVLDFNKVSLTLKNRKSEVTHHNESYQAEGSLAKDLLSVIIDKAQQPSFASQQPVREKTSDFSVADELTKLARLKKEGFLTDEEFEAQKKKLLES